MDPAEPLAQGEQVQPLEIQPRPPLDEAHHETGQGAEDQQGAQGPQPQHGDAQHRDGHRDGHAEGEQDGVGRPQADRPGRELEHRHPQGTGLELLVFPIHPEQVDEFGPGHLQAAEQHDQQEDQAEIHRSLARRPGGEGQGQHLAQVHLEHGQGEGGQAEGGQRPQGQSRPQGEQTHRPRLQKEHPGHLPVAEAQEQIGAQFPLAPAQEEAVGVQDETGQHRRHKDGEDVDQHHDGLHRRVAVLGQIDHSRLAVQGVEGIEQAHPEGEGEEIHPVVPEGAAHVPDRQLRKHRPSPLPCRTPPG